MTKEQIAMDFFKQGYNCAQAVVLTFAPEMGVDEDTALKFASSFGGGMGRLREVCGAVSGMFMVTGLLSGYTDPKATTEKAALYTRIQKLAAQFSEETDSIICRDLLKNKAATTPTPEVRNEGYYKARPCVELVGLAARLLETEFFIN